MPPAGFRLDPSDEVEALIWLPASLVTRGSLLLDVAIERAISVEELVAGGGEIALGKLPPGAKLVLSGEYALLARVLSGA